MDGISFNHFGVACRDIDKTADCYSALGYEKGKKFYDPLQNINICFLHHQYMPLVELLAPEDEKSPVVQILEKNGVTPYHACYSVDDLEASIKKFKKLGYITVSKPKEACAFEGRRVAFLYHRDMGLIEFVEK